MPDPTGPATSTTAADSLSVTAFTGKSSIDRNERGIPVIKMENHDTERGAWKETARTQLSDGGSVVIDGTHVSAFSNELIAAIIPLRKLGSLEIRVTPDQEAKLKTLRLDRLPDLTITVVHGVTPNPTPPRPHWSAQVVVRSLSPILEILQKCGAAGATATPDKRRSDVHSIEREGHRDNSPKGYLVQPSLKLLLHFLQ